MNVRLMRVVTRIWIEGAFVTPHGTEMLRLFDPVHGEEIGQARLAGAEDARRTIQAAERALPTDARTGNSERLEQLRTLHEAET
jgi:aldehyde dehydrogenase (NAD+)